MVLKTTYKTCSCIELFGYLICDLCLMNAICLFKTDLYVIMEFSVSCIMYVDFFLYYYNCVLYRVRYVLFRVRFYVL